MNPSRFTNFKAWFVNNDYKLSFLYEGTLGPRDFSDEDGIVCSGTLKVRNDVVDGGGGWRPVEQLGGTVGDRLLAATEHLAKVTYIKIMPKNHLNLFMLFSYVNKTQNCTVS